MSSSHLFFSLPIILLVLYFELSSGFHSAVFFSHLSLGDVAILNANFHLVSHFVQKKNNGRSTPKSQLRYTVCKLKKDHVATHDI